MCGVRPPETLLKLRAIETPTRVATIPCDQVLGVWRGGVSATQDSRDVTDVSGVYEGVASAGHAAVGDASLPSHKRVPRFWAGASGV
jgi:hypothetical protein